MAATGESVFQVFLVPWISSKFLKIFILARKNNLKLRRDYVANQINRLYRMSESRNWKMIRVLEEAGTIKNFSRINFDSHQIHWWMQKIFVSNKLPFKLNFIDNYLTFLKKNLFIPSLPLLTLPYLLYSIVVISSKFMHALNQKTAFLYSSQRVSNVLNYFI